jgi:hypothetical protein
MLKREDIRGNVRKVLQSTAIVPPGHAPWNIRTAIPLDIQGIELTTKGEYKNRKVYMPEHGYVLLSKQFEHNSNGEPVSAKVYSAGNKLLSTFQLSYDSLGRLSEMLNTGSDGKTLKQRYQYTYKESRIEVRHQYYDPLPATQMHVLINDQWVETFRYDSLGMPAETTNRKYNQQGFVSEIITRDTAGREIAGVSIEYEFDSRGNWTRRLSHDRQFDEYTLTLQTVVYSGENDRKPSLKELQGHWIGLLGKIKLKVTDKEAGLEIDPEFLQAKDFNYSQATGQFFLQDRFGTPIGFTAGYDGKILTLVSAKNDATYFLARVDTASMSTSERLKFEHAQILPNPQLENLQSGNLYGFKLKSGKIILKAEYEQTKVMSHQTLAAKKDGKWALFDYNGLRLTDFKYTDVQKEEYDYIKCRENDALRGLLDPAGKVILPCQFQLLVMTANRYIIASQAQANTGEMFGVFDAKGNPVLPIIYQSIQLLDRNGDAGATVLLRENNSSSRVLFNKDFKQVKVFPGDPSITYLYGPYYKLRDRRKEGLIDRSGNTIIPLEYEQLRFVSGRLLAAKKDNRYGLLDVQGNIVAPFVYDDILSESSKDITALHNEIRRHKAAVLFVKNGDFGYLNGYGQEIKPISTAPSGSQSGLKTFELPGLLSFEYPPAWQRSNNSLNIGEKFGHASVTVSNMEYTGDFGEWLKNQQGNSEWQIEMISGKRVYHKTEKKSGLIGFNEQEGYFQEVFLEINGQSAVQLVLKSNMANYPRLAQDFYNLRHTIRGAN